MLVIYTRPRLIAVEYARTQDQVAMCGRDAIRTEAQFVDADLAGDRADGIADHDEREASRPVSELAADELRDADHPRAGFDRDRQAERRYRDGEDGKQRECGQPVHDL